MHPTCTREYATAAASNCSGSESRGNWVPTAEANANADAACPDGNDVDSGIRT
jgi:hypothetical protein